MSIQNNTHDAHASQEELNMKKYLALLLAAIMALSLAACASTAKTEDAASTSGKLTMATEATFQPYEYYDGDAIVGIDVEVAQAIADKLGMELEVTDIAFDSIIPGVQTGKYDMGMAGMTVTDERKEQVNFSDSYATGVQVVIVKDDSPITSSTICSRTAPAPSSARRRAPRALSMPRPTLKMPVSALSSPSARRPTPSKP